MKLLHIVIFFLLITSSNLHLAISKENYAFINLDKIIKETNYGSKIYNEIKNLNDDNIKKLQDLENEIKFNENEINKKKNILSQNEFDNEINELRIKMSDYKIYKNNLVKNYEDLKSKNLNNFFSKINPMIQEYMDIKSINILFRQEDIFIGKNSIDITDDIIEIINSKIN